MKKITIVFGISLMFIGGVFAGRAEPTGYFYGKTLSEQSQANMKIRPYYAWAKRMNYRRRLTRRVFGSAKTRFSTSYRRQVR